MSEIDDCHRNKFVFDMIDSFKPELGTCNSFQECSDFFIATLNNFCLSPNSTSKYEYDLNMFFSVLHRGWIFL